MLVTPSFLSPFPHKWELPIKIKTERIDDRQSFERARHGPKKKAGGECVETDFVLDFTGLVCPLHQGR